MDSINEAKCLYYFAHINKLLLMLLAKRQFGEIKKNKNQKVKTRTDDNKITLTYKEIQSYGSRINRDGARVNGMITQPQATRAIDELLAKGFIEIVEYGGAYEKHKTVYSLTEDYSQWRWGDPPIRKRKRDIRRGFQGAKKGVANQLSHT